MQLHKLRDLVTQDQLKWFQETQNASQKYKIGFLAKKLTKHQKQTEAKSQIYLQDAEKRQKGNKYSSQSTLYHKITPKNENLNNFKNCDSLINLTNKKINSIIKYKNIKQKLHNLKSNHYQISKQLLQNDISSQQSTKQSSFTKEEHGTDRTNTSEQSTKRIEGTISGVINGRKQVFKTIKYIDEGTYGKVFLVQHLATGLIYSLKVVKKSALNQKGLRELIKQIKIQSFADHPNIVKLYQVFADQSFIYMILEPCLGQNLYQKIQKSKIEEKEGRQIIKQVSLAVDYLHDRDIIHRDIKPENILTHEKVIKVCDFGLSVYSPLLRNTQCGTPLYISPQMIKRQNYDSKVDIWSLGVLTYELLFKSIPFQIKTLQDFGKIVHQEVQYPQQISVTESAKNFIEQCMHKNCKKRINIKQVVDHEFLAQFQRYRLTL